MSRESGLQTFRDSDGLWAGHDVYEVCHINAWHRQPEVVLDFYNERRREIKSAQPNAGHLCIASLEEHFDVTVITQNIDDLHERAGSSHVVHLHGEIFLSRSESNPLLFVPSLDDVSLGDFAPDGCQLRPHVVFFGEDVPMIVQASQFVQNCNIFVVVGTSLAVYPAAGLLREARNATKWLIDPHPPQMDDRLRVKVIAEPASAGLPKLQSQLISQSCS